MYQQFFVLKYLIYLFLKMTSVPNFGFFIKIILVSLKNFDLNHLGFNRVRLYRVRLPKREFSTFLQKSSLAQGRDKLVT